MSDRKLPQPTDEELRKIEVDAASWEMQTGLHPKPAIASRRALFDAGRDWFDSQASGWDAEGSDHE